MPVLTPFEARQRLFQPLAAMVAYWRDLPEAQLLLATPTAMSHRSA
ncbi:hypothetical protein [Ensifer aridi]|nr:hypothetical protein [Ensifer aridi]